MSFEPGFRTKLVVTPENGDSWYMWTLVTSLIYATNDGGVFVVPINFQTDGATIPRVFHTFFSPTGRYFRAAVLHDYLLKNRHLSGFPRRKCDDLFYEAMLHCEVNKVRAYVMWLAVRAFGIAKLDF